MKNCVDCGNMKVFRERETATLTSEKLFRCINTHLTNPYIYEKKLNHKGQIDGMTHRLEFKKAKTCKDWDDMRPDEQDKEGWSG